VGILRHALVEAGLPGRTVLVVTSGHGEDMFEHA